jgi:hypothetical protein
MDTVYLLRFGALALVAARPHPDGAPGGVLVFAAPGEVEPPTDRAHGRVEVTTHDAAAFAAWLPGDLADDTLRWWREGATALHDDERLLLCTAVTPSPLGPGHGGTATFTAWRLDAPDPTRPWEVVITHPRAEDPARPHGRATRTVDNDAALARLVPGGAYVEALTRHGAAAAAAPAAPADPSADALRRAHRVPPPPPPPEPLVPPAYVAAAEAATARGEPAPDPAPYRTARPKAAG